MIKKFQAEMDIKGYNIKKLRLKKLKKSFHLNLKVFDHPISIFHRKGFLRSSKQILTQKREKFNVINSLKAFLKDEYDLLFLEVHFNINVN